MARVFEMPNSEFAVWGDDMSNENPPQDWTLIAQYLEQDHQVLHDQISAGSTGLSWSAVSGELSLNSEVVFDSTWISEQQAIVAGEAATQGFLADVQVVLKAGYHAQDDVDTRLSAIQTVLDAYPSHKAVVNTDIWPRARSMWGITLTLAQISGDAQAEAIYLWCVEHYVVLLTMLRDE